MSNELNRINCLLFDIFPEGFHLTMKLLREMMIGNPKRKAKNITNRRRNRKKVKNPRMTMIAIVRKKRRRKRRKYQVRVTVIHQIILKMTMVFG